MINRYFNPTVFKGEFYSPPVDMLAGVMKEAQQQYDKNYAIADEIRNRSINALDPDRARANKIQTDTTAKIDELVKKYNGDYSKANAGLRELLSNVRKQYQPGGEVSAIENNYNKYNEWVNSEQKRLGEGKITSDDFNIARERLLGNYTGIGEPSESGTYNAFNAPRLAEYTDGSKMVVETLKGIKPRKVSVAKPFKAPDGTWFNKLEEVEQIDENEANLAVQGALLSDNKWVEYNRQKAELLGVDPMDYVAQQINAYQQTFVPLHSGKFSQVNKVEYKGLDELAKLRMQQSHDMRMQARKEAAAKNLVDYKRALDKQDSEEDPNRPLEIIGTNPNAIKFKPIVPNETVEQYTGNDPIAKVMYGLPFVAPKIKKYPSVSQLLNSGGKGRNDVNYKLLQDIAKENPGKSDEVIWTNYNNSLGKIANYATAIMMDPYTQASQQTSAADQLIPRYMNSRATLYRIDENGTMVEETAAKSKELLGKMYDATTRKATVGIVGNTSSVGGDAPIGHVVNHGGYKYIISDNSTQMRKYNINDGTGKSLREKAFGHMRTGQTFSDVFEIPGDDGTLIPTIGVTRFENGVPITEYFGAYKDQFTSSGENSNYVPNYKDKWTKPGPGGVKESVNPYDIERRLLGNQYDMVRHKQKLPAKQEFDFEFDQY